ncbi:MAG: dTDP-4-dehydrorhamnose 3,5-epimerase [Chlamydiota bacterium]
MEVVDYFLSEVKHLRPRIFADGRGFFRETYRKPLYESLGIFCDFVQDNHSYSQKGTIRGMHFQRFPGQAKLITVMSGRIFDVFVDIRKESATFGKWEGVYLDAERGDQVFIPAGYAHGFCVVSEDAHVCYKVSAVYDPLEERCFRYDDPFVGIEWPTAHPLLSERDKLSPSLEEALR